jgi:hypothetical protein
MPERRELLADDRPVKLGDRAFDVLMALIDAPGAVISKDTLMARERPDRIADENNLQWQISALRAALGADCYPKGRTSGIRTRSARPGPALWRRIAIGSYRWPHQAPPPVIPQGIDLAAEGEREEKSRDPN